MKVRKKWNRLFAVLLVAVMIFNSQATALLAMDETGTEVITEAAEGSNTQTALEGYGADGGQTPAPESAPPAPEEDAVNPGTTPKEPSGDLAPTSEPVPASDPTPTQDSAPAPEPAPELNSESAPDSTIAPESTSEPDPALTPDSAPASDSVAAPESTPSDGGMSAPDQVQSDNLQVDQGIAADDGSINEGPSTEENIAPEQNAQNGDVQSEPVQGEEEKTGSDEDTEPSSAQKSESELNAAEEEETESETKTESETESESEVDVVMAEETEPAPELEDEIECDVEVIDIEDENEIMTMTLDGETGDTDSEAEVIKSGGGKEEKYATFAEAVEKAGDGDTVQLLKDTAEINTKLVVNKSITINLDRYNLVFKELPLLLAGYESLYKDTMPQLDIVGGTVKITGSGSVIGGISIKYSKMVGSAYLYKTILVEQNGELVIEGVKVKSIVNYGTTQVKGTAQVEGISQVDGTFILDNAVTIPMEIIMDFDGSITKYLGIGDNFSISDDTRIKIITFSKNGTPNPRGEYYTWIKNPKTHPDPIILFVKENGNDVIVLNELAQKIDIDYSEVKNPTQQNGKNVTEVIKTKVVVSEVSNSVILTRIVDDGEEKPEKKEYVYVSNTGKDTNSGYSASLPVKTMKKAIEKVAEAEQKKIYFLNTLEINDNQEWSDLPEGVTIERYEDFTGAFAKIIDNGTLTLKNIEIKGNGKPSDSLFEVSAGGTFVLSEKAVLSDNDHDHSKSSSYGGAIENNGGTIEIKGGTIKNCEAYNGGAIYCNGGKLIMDNGLLTENSAVEAGGAIMLANGAVMELNGGEISWNDTTLQRTGKAYGGGIAVGGYTNDSIQISPELHMTGGTITNNSATTCGGGILVQANAKAWITGGTISYNESQTVENYGGGGIYVNGKRGEIDEAAENEGYLYLENVLITGNYANRTPGGGIAGCDTSSVSVYLSKGAAIYGNTWHYGYGYDHYKSDIFIARNPYSDTAINISEYTKNGQPYLWKKEEDNNDAAANTLHKNMAFDLYTDEPFSENENKYNVVIKGNHSEVRGGGIGTNGTVVIGTDDTTGIDIAAKKTWIDSGNEDKRPTQIKVWLLRKQQGADDSTYERVATEYLKPDGEGKWGTVTFENQPTFLNGVSYEYTVAEDTTGPESYKVAVTKDADAENSWTITNTYKRDLTGTAQVSATKTLEGRDLQEGEFKFSLAPVSAVDVDGVTITDPNAAQTVTNAADGTITFKDLSYTQEGTYTYTLKEETTDEAGVTTDPVVYTVTVVMTDDGVSPNLLSAVTYSKDGAAVETAAFVNTYRELTGTAQVSATKTLTGRDLQEGEFRFSLTPVSAVDAGGTAITDPNAAQTVTNAADGTITFASLTYTQAGTYTYSLKEESTEEAGVTMDPAVYTVTVGMADDGVSNTLHPTVTYSKDGVAVDAVMFVNTYTRRREPTGTAQVSATKTLTGRDLKEGEFQFSLTPVGAVGADGTEITDPNAAQTVANAANGTITFKNLSYTQAGTYTYTLKEESKEEAGVTMDPAVYTVTVVMTDDGVSDTLHPTVTYSKDGTTVETVTFVNTYRSADGSISLGATKAFDRALTGDEFTFVLQEVDQDGKAIAAGVRQEKTNDRDGKILFDEISYDKEGTHYYQVSETAGSDPTILSYDATVYTVTVTVKNVDAKLVATPDQTADKVVFTNSSTRVRIDKRDAESGASIPGAVLRVVERDPATGALGAAVEEWTTDGTPHELLGKLSKNGSYELIEVSAPDGYLPTGPVDFTVNENGEIVVGGQVTDTVVMLDTKNTVSVLKVDEQGTALSGAHLVIENAAGEAVDSWVSDGAPHVTRGLARGHYALSEVEAPSGYHVAEDVPFDITGAETQPVEVQMSDTKIPEKDKGLLTVTKHLHLDGVSCDIGLHEAVFYVALFSDEAKTHRVSDVKAITINDNSVGTATFENLGKGTYYLGETDENGLLMVSKIVNDQVIYYPEYDKSAKVELETRKDEKTAELTNVYLEVPSGFYLAGRLNITKKVLVGGEEGTSEDTFYARVFSDKALTVPASDVVALEMKGAGEVSATVYDLPIGETLESSATYYVAETDESGTPLDPDEVTGYEISIDKKKVVLSADSSIQDVVITNDFVEEDETETSAEEGGTTPGSGSTAPKTGDETDYMRYLCYMLLSAGLFGVAAGQRRRKARRVRK